MSKPFIHPVKGPLHLGRSGVSVRTHKTMAKAFVMHDFLSDIKPPDVIDFTGGITDWGMMLNDTEGDCTIAEVGHALQSVTKLAGREVTIPDSVIQYTYEKVGGYVPGNPSTDNGCNIGDVLDYVETVGIGGYKIDGHAEVNITQQRVMQASYVFGPLDWGVNLPVSAQNQVDGTWDIVGNPFDPNDPAYPGSWGPHSVGSFFLSPDGIDFVTWGAIQHATWRWVMMYANELQACIFPLFKTPVPVDQLATILQQVGH